MQGETRLDVLLKNLEPSLHSGQYVFCRLDTLPLDHLDQVVMLFREAEGITVILPQALADALELEYSFVASWITLRVHSALEAVGLTAAFSRALAEHGISCNVVAAFYHDHIFVDRREAEKAMAVLRGVG